MKRFMAMRSIPSLLTRKSIPCITNRTFRVSLTSLNLNLIDASRLSYPYTTSSDSESSFGNAGNAGNAGTVKTYKFSDIIELINASPSSTRALIDVRERNELYRYGTIPGSLNIPLQSFSEAFTMTADEFRRLTGFSRPEKEVELIFFCRAGIRSSQAAQLALKAGWKRVGNYSGSWLDWSERGGKVLEVNPPD